MQAYQNSKTWISLFASLMKRHAIGAGPSCLVNLQRFGSWAAWATHIACLFIQACKKMKFMFFEVFQAFKKWNSCFLKIYSLFWKHSLKNYQWRTFGERRRTRTQPDDPYCELSICHSSVLIRARHDCTVRDLLCFETQHGTPLEIMRTRSVRLGRVHKQCTTILLKKTLFLWTIWLDSFLRRTTILRRSPIIKCAPQMKTAHAIFIRNTYSNYRKRAPWF